MLDAHRVFVMISKEQGCPNASLEAMAAGLPGRERPTRHVRASRAWQDRVLTGHDVPAGMAAWVEKLLINGGSCPPARRGGRDRAARHVQLDENGGALSVVLGL